MIDIQIGDNVRSRIEQLKFTSKIVINVYLPENVKMSDLMQYLTASYQAI